MSSTKLTQKTTPARRTLEVAQADFANSMRRKAILEAEREDRLSSSFQAFREAEATYKAAKKALDLEIAEDRGTLEIGKINAHVDDLKGELPEFYNPAIGSTYRDQDGAGFQFRATIKTVILDQEALAASLIHKHLWQSVGAELTVSATKAAKILETESLPGLSVQPQITVAAYGPTQEK